MSDLSLEHRAALLLATWGGCGYFPKGQGTVASIVALGLAYATTSLLQVPPAWFALAALALWVPSVWSASLAADHFGRHDPPQVVVDEVLGQWIAVAAVTQSDWLSWAAALALFRLFDIFKPWPIRKLESLPGGAGVVADDAAAGLCAMIVVIALHYFSLL